MHRVFTVADFATDDADEEADSPPRPKRTRSGRPSRPDGQNDPYAVAAIIRRRYPNVDASRARELGNVWSVQIEGVLDAMSDATYSSGRRVWPAEARSEIIVELAKLTLFLTERITEKRLAGRDPGSVDPLAEVEHFRSAEGKASIRDTGLLVSEHIWNGIYDESVGKYPLILASDREQPFEYKLRRKRSGRSEAVKRNHYIPVFAQRPWADNQNQVFVWRHWVDGGVRHRKRHYSQWGFEKFLYPQRIEEFLEAVETDAAEPYRRLLGGNVLAPNERRILISFFVVQMLRTPRVFAAVALGLGDMSRQGDWKYGVDPGSLRRAYETMFNNDDLHARYYSQLARQRWRILRPADGWVFPRIDTGVVVFSALGPKRDSLLFPLSPSRCLCIGPELADRLDPPIPVSVSLNSHQTVHLLRGLVAQAMRTLVLPCSIDLKKWTTLLSRHMSSSVPESMIRFSAWGPLNKL